MNGCKYKSRDSLPMIIYVYNPMLDRCHDISMCHNMWSHDNNEWHVAQCQVTQSHATQYVFNMLATIHGMCQLHYIDVCIVSRLNIILISNSGYVMKPLHFHRWHAMPCAFTSVNTLNFTDPLDRGNVAVALSSGIVALFVKVNSCLYL